MPTNTWQVLRYFTAPYKRQVVIFFSLLLIGLIGAYAAPFMISKLVDSLVSNSGLTKAGVQILVLYIILEVVDELGWRSAEFVARSFKITGQERVRLTMLEQAMAKSADFLSNASSGQTAYKINQIARSLDNLIRTLIWNIIPAIAGLTLSFVFLATANWMLGLMFLAWLLIALLIIFKRGTVSADLYEKSEDAVSDTAGLLTDIVMNNRLIRATNSTSGRLTKVYKKQKKYLVRESQAWGYGIITNAIKGWVNLVGRILAIIFVIYLYSVGQVSIGNVFLVISYYFSAGSSLWELSWGLENIFKIKGAINSSLNGLIGEKERTGPIVKKKDYPKNYDIEFKNASFAYSDAPNQKVLNNLNLKVKPGEKVGIVGKSGAGKSTIVNLLLNFYDLSSGSILVGGIDITTVDPSFIRSVTSYVPQDTGLLNHTIAQNIAIANPDASKKELDKAAKQAAVDEFAKHYPKGLETVVGERGVKLSGGQKQRVAIARAIIRNSKILILDEATSALDSESEHLIQKSLHRLMQTDITSIVIAHRLSTLKDMDRIVVLHKGKVAEDGTHNQLIDAQGIYASLWAHQKDGFIVDE